jgi:hypothetical protein
MASRKAPEPDYVVLCSETVDWQRDAETVAACGYSMLVHGITNRDLDFVRQLVKKHHLQSAIDIRKHKYLVWKANPAPPPTYLV